MRMGGELNNFFEILSFFLRFGGERGGCARYLYYYTHLDHHLLHVQRRRCLLNERHLIQPLGLEIPPVDGPSMVKDNAMIVLDS
jgi:hypothetical protein